VQVPFFGELYRRTTAFLMSPEVTRAESLFIRTQLQLEVGTHVLDLGCGAGRHLQALSGVGTGLVGLDFDRTALSEARRFAAAVAGDLRALPFRTAAFHACYCWYSTLFVFSEEENGRALAEAARVLRPGGRLLLQSVNPARLREAPVASFEAPLPDGARVREESRFDPATGRDEGTRTLILPSGEERWGRYSIRYYSLGELEERLGPSGLQLERAFGSVCGEPFDESSLDLIVLARRNGS